MIIDELVGGRVGHLLSVGDVYIDALEKSSLYQSRPVALDGARRLARYSAFPGTHDDFEENYHERVRESRMDTRAFYEKYKHRLWIQTTGVTDVRNIRDDAIQLYKSPPPHSFLINNPANPELRLDITSLRPAFVKKATEDRPELINLVTAYEMFWSGHSFTPEKPMMASELLKHYGDRDDPLYGISLALEIPYGRSGSFYATFMGKEDFRTVARQLRADPEILDETVKFYFLDIIKERVVLGELRSPRGFHESMDENSDQFGISIHQRYLRELSEREKTEAIEPQVRVPSRKKRFLGIF